MTTDILAQICARSAADAAVRRRYRSLADVRRDAEAMPPAHDFRAALRTRRGATVPAVIAECKRASPSKGVLRADYDAASIARQYVANGATCISVLTDEPYFQGSLADFAAVRAAVNAPLLRKDFIVSHYQVFETRAIGADCLLLIVAALDAAFFADVYAAASAIGLTVLVEVHDEAECERALAVGATLVGINNRDLRRFVTDLDVTYRLLPCLPDEVDVVSESGISSNRQLQQLAAAGVTAALIGEHCVSAADPGAALATLLGNVS